MDLNDIITLVKAGYTKEEINAMQTPPQVPAAGPAEVTPDPQPVPEENAPADQAPAPAPAPADGSGAYERLEARLNQFINIMQAQNLNANMSGKVSERSPEDILAGVIAPPARKKGE